MLLCFLRKCTLFVFFHGFTPFTCRAVFALAIRQASSFLQVYLLMQWRGREVCADLIWWLYEDLGWLWALTNIWMHCRVFAFNLSSCSVAVNYVQELECMALKHAMALNFAMQCFLWIGAKKSRATKTKAIYCGAIGRCYDRLAICDKWWYVVSNSTFYIVLSAHEWQCF